MMQFFDPYDVNGQQTDERPNVQPEDIMLYVYCCGRRHN